MTVLMERAQLQRYHTFIIHQYRPCLRCIFTKDYHQLIIDERLVKRHAGVQPSLQEPLSCQTP